MLLFLLSRWRVEGKENVPCQGPILVVANHMTMVDPPLLSVSLGRYAVFMGKEELFRSRLGGYFMSGLGVFPVRRGRIDRATLRLSERILAAGHALAMFPEGVRSRNHKLQRAFPGSAVIALRTGVPIVPAAITGTETIGGLGWLRRPTLTVNFGRPFQLPPASGKADRQASTDYIMERIAELLPPEYRGVYEAEEVG